MKAIAIGDMEAAEVALERILQVSDDPKKIVYFASYLADAGDEGGAQAVKEALENNPDLPISTFITGASALAQYYVVRDRESEGVEEVEKFILPRLEAEGVGDRDKARLNNQLSRMYYGASRYEDAQRVGIRAVDLAPDVTAYKFNLSLVYEARDLYDLAEQVVDEYMTQKSDETDSDHLGQAIDIYLKRDRHEDVRAAFSRLMQVDPAAAALKTMLNDELRSLVQ
ncbi:hypothetical protein AQJ58_00355 [Streptomyces sp. DSM 15324]|nr:hypothetical protein AQJ58_00355 [Streptomyces sp. DSM 15324]